MNEDVSLELKFGDLCHDTLAENMPHELSFDENKDYETWRAQVKEKLSELLRMKIIEKNACPFNMKIEEDIQMDGYRRIRFVFESEKNAFVPCYLCIPDTGKEKYPLVIAQQGHSTGFHNSIGIKKYPEDENYHPRGQFALQAVKNGYAALAIENRGMGERKTYRRNDGGLMCAYQGLSAIVLGRTTIGERIWDVSKALDLVGENFPQIDMDKIAMTGNSGGGTLTYYAGCMEDRIKIVAPSCGFCTFEQSILLVYHCACNYIPDMYKYFDMQDVACLIAPKRLGVLAGETDWPFRIAGVKDGYKTIEKIYEKAGVPDRCHLFVKDVGHYWTGTVEWDAINQMAKEEGWF